MAGLLMGWVYYYDFSKPQQNVLLALADHGKEDGTHIHPSIETLMWKLDSDRRHVQRTLRELEQMGVLIPVAYATGGRARPTEYEMHLEAAPIKETPPPGPGMKRIWEMLKGGVQTAVSDDEAQKGGVQTAVSTNSAKGRTFEHQKGGLLNTKGGLLNTKGGVQTARTNITISNHQDNHAHVREEVLTQKKEIDAEPEPEADPVPASEPLGFTAWSVAYRKQHGYAVKTSKLMGLYREYRASLEVGDDAEPEEATSDVQA